MADATTDLAAPTPGRLTTADGRPLKAALGRAQSRARRRAFLLVLPLLLFIVITFIVPIGQMLHRSIHNDGFSRNMPQLSQWFADTEPGTEPDEVAYAALAADLKGAAEAKTIGIVGTRVNYEMPGTRSLFTSTGRKARGFEPPYREAVLEADPKWGNPSLWGTMRQVSRAYSPNFFLASVDLARDNEGNIVRAPQERRVYVMLFQRTFLIAGLITVLCLLLGFPIAHLLATLPLRTSNLLMILVLLPFWTSLLVRTTSWIVLLQGQGVVNNSLVATGLISDANRIQMIYNQTGTIIAMTHILLPFMILPLYSVMRPIPPSYVRAARSLGASSWTAFRRIYLPQTLPGIGAGALLVFILGVGYYITPALVGGASGQLISNLIAFHMQDSLNWSLAAALAAVLLAAVLILYWLYDRLVGIDNLKLG
ncbi:ABC transporter permease [Cereibacter azotoformans]|uniref:Putative spermidine/putrescine transport system permease protein n=1 Tax=Cereibacter azotoformans TaxID=43057 RepID=A0A2T5K6X1_9RHOB|nr:ABC transporter permease [Cereibacter azotoformans]AXQ92887.1 ABC transporter permease [Cereibacter sphaeroides]MBO4169441.1 ABC transporter permease [Cereibacter azotoformans]PTR18118.1 putative spermidine/putrescine transport system permease protein [Cereibacter azotoformans]UIJ31175.1 ABC transporter permease [Cereibacter azotoformans]